MGHTYTSNLHHAVFSTKERRPSIKTEFRNDLWAYMGGIARQNGFKALEIGGVEDHCHALLSLPGKMDISKALQLIKGGSSKWINENHGRFEWQEGFASFTIGISQTPTTVRYIQNQEQHHKKISFESEFIAFLKKHNIEYDERYVFG
jgi:putative transposase